MILLDANVILRYLLNDNEEMAEKAESWIETDNSAVTVEVIAEVVYVLSGVYSLSRQEITNTIKTFLALVNCPETDILTSALDTYGQKNLDFVDCVLFAYHKVRDFEIATFDKKLLKLIEESEQMSEQ